LGWVKKNGPTSISDINTLTNRHTHQSTPLPWAYWGRSNQSVFSIVRQLSTWHCSHSLWRHATGRPAALAVLAISPADTPLNCKAHEAVGEWQDRQTDAWPFRSWSLPCSACDGSCQWFKEQPCDQHDAYRDVVNRLLMYGIGLSNSLSDYFHLCDVQGHSVS